MATKKRKRTVTKNKKTATKKKAKTAPKKRSSAGRPKKPAKRTSKQVTARKAAVLAKARKPAPRKAQRARPPARPSKASTPRPVRRQDRPGHLDPRYAEELREQSGPQPDEPRAFLETSRSPNDDLAEALGEEVVQRATTGEDEGEEALDPIVPEEQGGPFVETNAAQEYAQGTDLSNPKDAKREPFPKT
jgi:hypothetical protein